MFFKITALFANKDHMYHTNAVIRDGIVTSQWCDNLLPQSMVESVAS